MLSHPHTENGLPVFRQSFLWFVVCLMTLVLSLVTTGNSLATSSLYLHFRCILIKFPQDLLSLGQAASAFCHRRSAPDPPSFSWSFPGMSPVCPHLSWAQGWLQSVRHCITRAKKKNHLPQSAGSTPNASQDTICLLCHKDTLWVHVQVSVCQDP